MDAFLNILLTSLIVALLYTVTALGTTIGVVDHAVIEAFHVLILLTIATVLVYGLYKAINHIVDNNELNMF